MSQRALFFSSKVALVLVSTLAATACVPSIEGGPVRAYAPDVEAEAFKIKISPLNLNRYYLMDEAERTNYRNEYITAKMAYIDIRYHQYERSLTKERQGIDFLSTMTIAGLAASGGLVASAATKTALATATGLVNAGQTAFDEKIQFKQTLNIFINQMKTTRAMVSTQILKKLSYSDSDYPLPLAISELEDYYQAGTLTGAISVASQESAVKTKEEESVAAITKSEPLGVIQGYSAENLKFTDVGLFTCDAKSEPGYSTQAQLILRAGEIIRTKQFGHIDAKVWTSFGEISKKQLKGKTTIIEDSDHPETAEAARLKGYLEAVTGMPPVVLAANNGSASPWYLSVVVCP